MAITVCGSCDKCYSEYAPTCQHCGKTLQQQIDEEQLVIREMKAEFKGYERGMKEGVKIGLGHRIYNFLFIW